MRDLSIARTSHAALLVSKELKGISKVFQRWKVTEEKSGRFGYFSGQTKKNKSNQNDGDQGKGPDALCNFCIVCEKICHHFRDTSEPGEFFFPPNFTSFTPGPPSI